jgi:3',5'-cyclic AMP phosphodiesterase CpdA
MGICVLSLLLFSAAVIAQTSSKPQLRFRPNHSFIILQLSDLHYGGNIYVNAATTQLQNYLIQSVRPDVVVITGDAVSGYDWDKKTSGFFQIYWQQFTQPYTDNRVPYAYVFGNHDGEADLTLEQMGELDKTNPTSLFGGTKDVDPFSYSNYLLEVKSAFPGKEDQNAMLMWLLDSKSYGCQGNWLSYGCINGYQLDWYTRESKKRLTSAGNLVGGFSFFHIPFQEYYQMYNEVETGGEFNEGTSCPMVNTGAYRTFSRMGNMKAVFCGHDHGNEYYGKYGNVWLYYGRKSGYGSYSAPRLKKGGRVINVTEVMDEVTGEITFTWESHVLEEDGSIIKSGSLRKRGGGLLAQQNCYKKSERLRMHLWMFAALGGLLWGII